MDWKALISGLGMDLRIEYSVMIFIMVWAGQVSDGSGRCDSCENAATQGVKPLEAVLELKDLFKNRFLSGMAMDPVREALIYGLGMGLKIEYLVMILIMVLGG